MKKNVFLFAILSFLLIVVYVVEEVGGRKRSAVEESKDLLFNAQELGEIKGFQTKEVFLEKRGTSYVVMPREFPVDEIRLNKVFSIFSTIRVVRTITEKELKEADGIDRHHFFPVGSPEFSFIFSKGKVEFTLGKKLEYDHSFYLEITRDGKRQWLVVRDTGVLPHAYSKKNAHRSSDRYLRFKALLYLTSNFFYDTRPFSPRRNNLPMEKWEKLRVENIRNRPVVVYLKSRTTDPEIYSGLVYNQSFFDAFKKALHGMRGSEVIFIDQNKNALKELVSSIEVHSGASNMKINLYRKMGDKSGHFLAFSGEEDKIVYKVDQQAVSSLFFSNAQDFWSKKVKLPFLEKDQFRRNIEMSFPAHQGISLTLVKDKSFFVKGDLQAKFTVKMAKFKDFIDFLKTPADRVSLQRTRKIDKKESFSFLVGEKKFSIYYDGKEITLFDWKNSIGLHYWVGDSIPIGLKWSDFFQ